MNVKHVLLIVLIVLQLEYVINVQLDIIGILFLHRALVHVPQDTTRTKQRPSAYLVLQTA